MMNARAAFSLMATFWKNQKPYKKVAGKIILNDWFVIFWLVQNPAAFLVFTS